jgi:hypothetical protein
MGRRTPPLEPISTAAEHIDADGAVDRGLRKPGAEMKIC